ncbi:hypothetical protein COO91_00832 [Nostoc flagelliforme CCNUN1]|uniref:Uncharacterized protein n=1 Tax=Nostoc flagelliforme CCNUN1 TaxID=2038116 RepID=A0A2K8SHP7_9NOSO|nr:hypothetical protein COO91_00832 [Nostoc flagelliforme CCNUN1]
MKPYTDSRRSDRNCVSQLKWMAGKGSGKLFDLLKLRYFTD